MKAQIDCLAELIRYCHYTTPFVPVGTYYSPNNNNNDIFQFYLPT